MGKRFAQGPAIDLDLGPPLVTAHEGVVVARVQRLDGRQSPPAAQQVPLDQVNRLRKVLVPLRQIVMVTRTPVGRRQNLDHRHQPARFVVVDFETSLPQVVAGLLLKIDRLFDVHRITRFQHLGQPPARHVQCGRVKIPPFLALEEGIHSRERRRHDSDSQGFGDSGSVLAPIIVHPGRQLQADRRSIVREMTVLCFWLIITRSVMATMMDCRPDGTARGSGCGSRARWGWRSRRSRT